MFSINTASILFSPLLIAALAGNGIAQNVNQSALALKMRENTRLTIQRNTTPSQNIRQIRINVGSIKTKVNPQTERKYEIISAVSVASVNGTEF